MRLRSTSEYAEAIRAILPNAEDDAMGYGAIAQQAAGRLGLTPSNLEQVRPQGNLRVRNQHRSTLSAVLLGMRGRGEIQSSGTRRQRKYWRSPRARYAGATRCPTHEEIARRAYEIFERRGCAHGNDEQDWLQAERELRGV